MVIKITHTAEDFEKVFTCLNMDANSKPGEQLLIVLLEFSDVNYAKKTFDGINEIPGIICSLQKFDPCILFLALDLQDYNIHIVNY